MALKRKALGTYNSVYGCLTSSTSCSTSSARWVQDNKYRTEVSMKNRNARFSSKVWCFEEARTLLLLAGFEQSDEFLILPDGVDLQYLQGLLQKASGYSSTEKETNVSSPISSTSAQTTAPNKSPSLKLGRAAKGASQFDSEIKADMTLLSYLLEMGYSKAAAENALIATGNKGVQPAMDCFSIADDAGNIRLESEKNLLLGCLTDGGALVAIVANPYKVAAAEEALQYASQGPHVQVASETRPQSSEMLGIMDNNSMMPAAISRYKKSADEKHKFQEKQRQEAIEAARRDKIAQRKHREYLMKNMQAERDETKEKFEREKAARLEETQESTGELQMPENQSDHVPVQVLASSLTDERSRIRIRLPDGQDTTVEIGLERQIRVLYQHVSRSTELSLDDFVLHVAHPPSDLEDLDTTLKEAGLYPTVVLIVRRLKSPEAESESTDIESTAAIESGTMERHEKNPLTDSTQMEDGV